MSTSSTYARCAGQSCPFASRSIRVRSGSAHWLLRRQTSSLPPQFSSTTTIDGFLALPPEHHALLLAAHSWAHEPLRILRDLIDIAAVAAAADQEELSRIAGDWGISRLWKATSAAADGVLRGGRRPLSVRVWARNLSLVRERTVLENHLERWLSDFSIMSFGRAASTLPATFRLELARKGDESRRDKLARSKRALRNAFRRRSEHDEPPD